MKRHSSIVFILCMKLLVALAVQSASATSHKEVYSPVCSKSDKHCYTAILLICKTGKAQLSENCEELKDIRGPYKTKRHCLERIHEIMVELWKWKPKFDSKGYMCELRTKL